MNETNDMIQQHSAGDPLLYYADLATPMLLDNGEPNPNLFVSDGLHLNEAGYVLWTQSLRPVLKTAMGE